MAHMGNHNPYGFSDDTDIILRSSDNVDFYVIGALLRYVSLMFKDMFASSRSDNNEKKDNLPVVPVAEDSRTLHLLLDTIYPSATPQLSRPIIAWKVSKAAQKYMMNTIESKLKREVFNSNLIVEEPLSIYVMAADLEWEDVAIDAARRTLKTPLQKLTCVDELYEITGASFYRFLKYRHLCENSQNPEEEVLPPLHRQKDLIKTRISSSVSDTPHSDHIDFATAPKPYTRSELSDLILRTSDSVDFYVVSAFLRFSSPFFNRKYPLENPVMKDGLAVIDVQENSNVLYHLLSFIYPTQVPMIRSAGLYAQLVFAARKYEMIDIEDKVKKHATASSLVTMEPPRVYAVASAFGWTDLAKTAALNTLNTPFRDLSYGDEIHLMTGTQLFRLMRFHFACAVAACKVFDTYTFQVLGWQGSVLQGILENGAPEVLSERLKACPRGFTVTNVYDQGVSKGIAELTGDGSSSGVLTVCKILQRVQAIPKAVEEAVSEVDLLSEEPVPPFTGPIHYLLGNGNYGAEWQACEEAMEHVFS